MFEERVIVLAEDPFKEEASLPKAGLSENIWLSLNNATVKLDQDVEIFGGRVRPRGGRRWQAGRKWEEAQEWRH